MFCEVVLYRSELVFRAPNINPPIESDRGRAIIIDNYGNWKIGVIAFNENASFDGFYTEYAPVPLRRTEYKSWAVLPMPQQIIDECQ